MGLLWVLKSKAQNDIPQEGKKIGKTMGKKKKKGGPGGWEGGWEHFNGEQWVRRWSLQRMREGAPRDGGKGRGHGSGWECFKMD